MTDSDALFEIRDLLREILAELRVKPASKPRRKRASAAPITDLDQVRAERILQRLRSR